MIVANSEYVFTEGNLGFQPSGFLAQILVVSGLSKAPQTTLAPITSEIGLLTTTAARGLPQWALAIIIPCIIAAILIPCWIFLCVSES